MAEHWRMRSKQVGEAERCTIEYEQLERQLREVRVMLGKDRTGTRSDGTVRGCLDARLYASMVQHNIGVGEIISKWDADHDGFISRHEFKSGVLKVVPNAAEEEVDELFDSVPHMPWIEPCAVAMPRSLRTPSDAEVPALCPLSTSLIHLS